MTLVRATIGLDIGGTKIGGGVIDEKGVILAQGRRDTRELSSQYQIDAVGVACAAYIDRSGSTVYFSPNLAWRDEPLKERLEAALDLPVTIENDANAAAWGEFRFGAAVD